jgi:hypothetical protein
MIISLDKPQVWLAANWRQAAARSFVRVCLDYTLRLLQKHLPVSVGRVPKKFRISSTRRDDRECVLDRHFKYSSGH